MTLQSLAFFVFPVADLDRARTFYETHFNLPVLGAGDSSVDYDFAGIRLRIYIHEGEYHRQHSGLLFFVSDIDATTDRLHAAGVEFRDQPHDEPWGGRITTVADPDGNLFTLLDDAYRRSL